MQSHQLNLVDGSLRIEGFSDKHQAVNFEMPEKKRLADLALHHQDLHFAKTCVELINQVPEEPAALRESLWQSAIVSYFKCFGEGERFLLDSKKIYKSEPPEAILVFKFFKSLRNKHIIHDENSYSQALVGAILNPKGEEKKVCQVISCQVTSATLGQESWSNLHLLVTKALTWVVCEYDALAERMANKLESKDYEVLESGGRLSFTVPMAHEVHVSKKDRKV